MYESGEMYLETIFSLKKKNGYVRSVNLVNAMGFVKSSVSAAAIINEIIEVIASDISNVNSLY